MRTIERRHGLDRGRMAEEMVFVSHETYTPARGGSADAEVDIVATDLTARAGVATTVEGVGSRAGTQ